MNDPIEQLENWWHYEELESGEPYEWGGAARGGSPYDNMDFHLDLGCGTVPKGRIGVDRYWAPEVKMLMDLAQLLPPSATVSDEGFPAFSRTIDLFNNRLKEMDIKGVAEGDVMDPDALRCLPFPDSSIESIISHHFFEHLYGEQMIRLMDECHRVLVPGGIIRIIVPLFPSSSAVDDPDHKQWITERSFEIFCGFEDNHWAESFSVPYTSCRFEMVDLDHTAPTPLHLQWTDQDARELRVALRKRG